MTVLVFFIPMCLLIGKAVGIEQPCMVDGDCTSGHCNGDLNDFPLCQGDKAVGAACSNDSDCGSNSCSANTCQSKQFSIIVGF